MCVLALLRSLAYFKGSAAAADPLVAEVPLGGGYDPPMGGYDPLGGNFGVSKLGSLGVFKAWYVQKKDSLEKMMPNGTLKLKIGDNIFHQNFSFWVKTGVPGGFQDLGPSKKDSPEKMTSNEPLKSEIGDIFFFFFF